MREYWLERAPEDVANKIIDVQSNWSRTSTNPVMQAWSRNTIKYFSNIIESGYWETSLNYEGSQGELVKMIMPVARNIIRQLLTIIVKQNLDFTTIARATGVDVRTVTRLGDALSTQITQDQGLDKKLQNVVEYGLVQGCAYTKTTWRTDKGIPWESDPLEGQENLSRGYKGIKYVGDVEISHHDVYDVYFDYTIENWEDVPWVTVRTVKNRWDLIAQFPDLEQEILSLDSTMQSNITSYDTFGSEISEDSVEVFELFVRPSPALPNGRLLVFSDPKTVYWDSDNFYGTIPVEQFKPEPIFRTGFGYPALSSILPGQEMLDHSFSAISTNEAAFAVKNIVSPRDANISVDQINGMNFISYTPGEKGGKPETLQLGGSNPETFKFIDLLNSFMANVSNLNEAIRGQPLPGVTSGVAYATLTANALEFITAASKEYVNIAKRTMWHAINAYRKFGGNTPRMVRLAKQSNAKLTTSEWVGTDLDPIQYVDLKITNPLYNTMAGREQLAEKMFKFGIVKDMDSFVKIIDGQPLESIIKPARNQEDLIQNEDEALQEGREVPVLQTDDHPLHMHHHAALLDDPDIRINSKISGVIMSHIIEHLRLEKEKDPAFAIMVKTGIAPNVEPPPPAPEMGPINPDNMGQSPILEPSEGSNPRDSSDIIAGSETSPAQPSKDLLGRI